MEQDKQIKFRNEGVLLLLRLQARKTAWLRTCSDEVFYLGKSEGQCRVKRGVHTTTDITFVPCCRKELTRGPTSVLTMKEVKGLIRVQAGKACVVVTSQRAFPRVQKSQDQNEHSHKQASWKEDCQQRLGYNQDSSQQGQAQGGEAGLHSKRQQGSGHTGWTKNSGHRHVTLNWEKGILRTACHQ